MPSNSNFAQSQEITDLRNRVEWLDGERRTLLNKFTELEQRMALQSREIQGREQRIQELEKQLSSASAQMSRLTQVDTQLSQFKDEVVKMIEQYDQRRIRSENELDRLRRIEHETIARELADIHKELPVLGQIKKDMELRITEESRLAILIGEQKNKISSIGDQIDKWENALSFIEEKEKQNSRQLSETQTSFLENTKRMEKIRDRIEMLGAGNLKTQSWQQEVTEEQVKIRESLKSWMEQIQIGEYERNQRIENWQRVLDKHEENIEKFSKEWITFSDQYKEAKMAVQTLSEWQKQLEQQQRETNEMIRIETRRMQSRWDDFQLANETKWKNFSIESDQRTDTSNRHEKQVQEQFLALEEEITKLEQNLDLLQRVQNAQTDAIKRLPLLWIEEVEKAIAQNPNRRRQPALVPVREE